MDACPAEASPKFGRGGGAAATMGLFGKSKTPTQAAEPLPEQGRPSPPIKQEEPVALPPPPAPVPLPPRAATKPAAAASAELEAAAQAKASATMQARARGRATRKAFDEKKQTKSKERTPQLWITIRRTWQLCCSSVINCNCFQPIIDKASMRKLKLLFDQIDVNGDGFVSSEEWLGALGTHKRELQYFFGNETVTEMSFKMNGKRKNSVKLEPRSLTWPQFEKEATAVLKDRRRKGLVKLRKVFEAMDGDGDGVITSKEWGEAVKKQHEELAKFFALWHQHDPRGRIAVPHH
jgi:Ca2+-binding EF-hand superfamily protein